jgi:hypothetical protein
MTAHAPSTRSAAPKTCFALERRAHSADADLVVADQASLGVQKKHAEVLAALVRDQLAGECHDLVGAAQRPIARRRFADNREAENPDALTERPRAERLGG